VGFDVVRDADARLSGDRMIVASMATLPRRRDIALRAVASLLPQVDVLHLWLDKHSVAESELAEFEFCQLASSLDIPWHRIGFARGDRGDGGKFAALGMLPDDAAWLVCDDDIEYPSDYVPTMLAALERVEVDGPCVVGLHALRLPETCKRYRDQRQHVQHCLRFETRPDSVMRAHVLGTSSVITRPRYVRGFEAVDVADPPNVGDLHLAAWCERASVPRYCMPLPREGWLGNLLPDGAPSIWTDRATRNENRVVQGVTWGAL
jgi:hypothetical protein